MELIEFMFIRVVGGMGWLLVTGGLTYAAYRYVNRKRRIRRPEWVAVYGLMMPLWFIVTVKLLYINAHRPFDRALWQAHRDRYEQTRDLMTNQLPGKTSAEVRALLGVPDGADTLRAGAGEWVYMVGCPPRGLCIDAAGLILTFEGGKVARSRVINEFF